MFIISNLKHDKILTWSGGKYIQFSFVRLGQTNILEKNELSSHHIYYFKWLEKVLSQEDSQKANKHMKKF